jgi:hypothetical protein
MSEQWFRWFHGTVNDPKWKVVAMRAGNATKRQVTTGNVLSVWACMMERASQSSPRGSITGMDDEDVAACLELDVEVVSAIRAAMEGKTLASETLVAWAKRQPQRERDDDHSTSRVQAFRARKKEQETQGNATQHQATPRREEIREEKKDQEPRVRADAEEPKPEPTAAGLICKALILAGMPINLVNPSHPDLLRLIAADVQLDEFVNTYRECGKGNLKYLCAAIEGRRREAAERGAVPGKAATPKPASHSKYVEPPPPTPDEAFKVESGLLAQMLEDGLIGQDHHDERLQEARERMQRARAGPAKKPPAAQAPHPPSPP